MELQLARNVKRILIFLLLLAAVGILGFLSSAGGRKVTYLTAPIERGDITTTITATGTLEAVVTVKVGSQLSGQVEELFADFNDEVRRGQVIARLDQQSLKAKVREARAALDIAEATFKMQEAGVDRAGSALARTRAKTKVLEAQTARARAALKSVEQPQGKRYTATEVK